MDKYTHTNASTHWAIPGLRQGSERPVPVEAAAAAAADGFIDWHCWHRARRKTGGFVRNLRGGSLHLYAPRIAPIPSRFFMVMGKRVFPFNEKGNECHVRAIRGQMKMTYRVTYRYYNLHFFFFYLFFCMYFTIFVTKIDKKWSSYFLINLFRRITCFL